MARLAISTLSPGDEDSTSVFKGFTLAGMKTTRSSRRVSLTSSATRRCP